jgi:hypothetical protein
MPLNYASTILFGGDTKKSSWGPVNWQYKKKCELVTGHERLPHYQWRTDGGAGGDTCPRAPDLGGRQIWGTPNIFLKF